ncbi:MAG: peptidoglycan-binding protein [Parasporobacterium sp.]|nr:peptidoglycan-binding protein [Parasporobacterium sp.]
MRKGIVFLIALTLIMGSLFPVYAEPQKAETRSPRMSEKITPPAEEQAEPAEEAPQTLEGAAGNAAGALNSLSGEESAPKAAGAQASDGSITLSCDGYTAKLVKYGVNQYNSVSPDMYLFFDVVNNSDMTIDLWFDDVVLDGVKMLGTGIYDIAPGTDSGNDPERIWVMPRRNNEEEGSAAILDPHFLQGTLMLEDADSGDDLALMEVTIDLSLLDSVWNDFRTDDYEPSSQTDPGPSDYTPAPSYNTLFEGSSGEAVRKMQEKLIELGYLYDVADGNFGPRTAAAVKDFNEANGLDGGTVADYTMQNLLFSGLANPYTEPWIPLTIGSYFEWDPIPEVNTFFFKVEVTNHSRTRTIKGYELSVYYTNVWGEKLDGGVTYTQTMTQSVLPGQTLYSATFNLGNWYSVDTVWVGVSRIVFDDGEIRDAYDVDYYSCVVPSRIGN